MAELWIKMSKSTSSTVWMHGTVDVDKRTLAFFLQMFIRHMLLFTRMACD